jgi:hypothetical protein
MKTSKSDGKITWKVRGVDAVANEMMRGLDPARYNKTPEEERQKFRDKYRALIEEILPYVPRGYSGIGAAVCKCAIRYSKERAILFLQNLKDTIFHGRKDPVYLFSLWLDNKNRQKRGRIPYKMAMVACRAFCQERELTELRPGRDQDVFEWSEDWQFDPHRYRDRTASKREYRTKKKLQFPRNEAEREAQRDAQEEMRDYLKKQLSPEAFDALQDMWKPIKEEVTEEV